MDITQSTYPGAGEVAEIAGRVGSLLERKDRHAALRLAIEASGPLLRAPTDALRVDLRMSVFKQFSRWGDSYQANDFESVDYGQYDLLPDLPLFRGPPVPPDALAKGEYFCVFGAAQTFGRLVRNPWAQQLSEAIDLPVLNISRGGAGPEFFLDPRLVDYARNARFLVLQVMSGRSVGCEEYPGGRRITLNGKNTKVQRWDVLEEMWNKDPALALHYVERWNASYLDLYGKLRTAIGTPTLLLWISDRDPSGWNPKKILRRLTWGSFPQLVGKRLYRNVAELFDEHFELVTEASPEHPTSRITGEPCPYFDSGKKFHTEFNYYPSSASHAKLAQALTPWARDVLARAR